MILEFHFYCSENLNHCLIFFCVEILECCRSECFFRICVTDRYSQKLLELLPEPKTVWKYMLAIAQIPRGSNKKGECVNNKRITAFLKQAAEDLGCETYIDSGENLIIRKKATPGSVRFALSDSSRF